jgi:hypothetical protein
MSCSGSSTQYGSWSPGGTVVSVGFQNSGFAHNLWTSQMFVQTPTSVYFQVINSSLTSTEWGLVCVIDTSATEEGGAAAEPVFKTAPYEAPK